MRDAQVLILDEPTASLDARAEYELFLRFADLTRGRMAVLISHRFSTVRMADRILVLADGELVEQGTHQQLVAQAAATRSCSRCRRRPTDSFQRPTRGRHGMSTSVRSSATAASITSRLRRAHTTNCDGMAHDIFALSDTQVEKILTAFTFETGR